jgi:sugar phosphate permease
VGRIKRSAAAGGKSEFVATGSAAIPFSGNMPERTNASVTASRIRWSYVSPTLLIIWIVGMLDKSNIAIVIANPQFLNDLKLTHKQALLGWLTTGLIIAYGAAAPAWGWLVSKVGARRAAIISLALWGVVCVVSGLSASYGLLLTSRIVLGVAEAALYPVTLSIVAHWFPLKERGRATAYWWIGTMIGPMVTGILITGLIVLFGWRVQFYALGALALLLPLPMAYFLMRDTPREHPSVNTGEIAIIESGMIETDDGAPGRILRGKVRNWYTNHRFWLVVISIVFNSIFFWGWSVWLPTYLKTTRHFTFSHAGYLTFIIYGCATLTIIGVSLISDRMFRRAPLAGAGWLLSGAFLIAATMIPDRTACVVLMTLSLCAQQTGVSCAQMLYHSVVGTRDMANSQGYATGVAQILGSFSPVMIGYFLSRSGGDFTLGFMILAAAVVVAAACMAALAWEGL